MLSGGDNIRELLQEKVTIWTDWPLKKYREETNSDISQADFEARILADVEFANRWGDLGPVYGAQWRRWKTANGTEIDQVQQVIDDLKTNPTSRRIIWDGWNVAELDQMALPPCHKHYQFYVNQKTNTLSGAMVQRLPLATLKVHESVDSLFDYRIEHLSLPDYQSHGAIAAQVAV